MLYFKNCITQKDAQKVYRFFAKELHPDKGGTHCLMIELQRQYDEFKPYQIPINKTPGGDFEKMRERIKDFYRARNGYKDGDEPSYETLLKNFREKYTSRG